MKTTILRPEIVGIVAPAPCVAVSALEGGRVAAEFRLHWSGH